MLTTRKAISCKSVSTSRIWRGLPALGVGHRRPRLAGVTFLALVVLFAAYAFIWAGFEAVGRLRAAPPARCWAFAPRIVDIAAGIVALAWPGPTALVLVLLVASWAIVTGVLEVFAAFGAGQEQAPAPCTSSVASRPWRSASCCSPPDMGAISLALLFGLFNLISGSWMLVRDIELRRTDAKLQSVAAPTEQKVAA